MLILFYIAAMGLVIYGILISYYESWWKAIPVFTSKAMPNELPGLRITIIIPARNEEQAIGLCLRSLLNQTYAPELLQIIVVNDHSTDETVAVVNSFGESRIQLIQLGDYVDTPINSYKKKAIEIAVGKSTGQLIVTTDADCVAPTAWIETIAAFYHTQQAAFIAAPVRIGPDRSLLAIFQSLDFLMLQGITGASVHKRFHSMCNGANMVYEKKAFYEVEGFAGIDTLASGDDMLLMHKIYRRYPDRVFFLKSPEAIVTTRAAENWRDFFNQRIRWASKAGIYKDKRIFFVLLLVYLLNLSLFILLIAGFFNPFWFLCLLILIVIKFFLELSFIRALARFFSLSHLLVWFPFLQPLHIIYTVATGFFGQLGKYEWKGRKVN